MTRINREQTNHYSSLPSADFTGGWVYGQSDFEEKTG
jgi:hypothetical protein